MYRFILFFIFLSTLKVYGQSVRIFIDDRAGGSPDPTVVQSNYFAAGFVSVSITSGVINGAVTTANYDVLIINEYYNYNSGIGNYVPNFLSVAQRTIAQSFVSNGGHVIWIAESWNNSPLGGPIAVQTNMITTVNNVFGTSLSYGPFYDNGGMGSPNMPRIHPSSGPGALSPSTSIMSTGSYATLLNVPTGNAVYTSQAFDLFNSFDPCIHTTLALFPAFPVSGTGTIIASTEVNNPFKGYPPAFIGFPPPPPIYNTQLDARIAQLHFRLITGASMTSINSWANNPANVNSNCPTIILPVELVYFDCSLERNHVLINWETASEKDCSHFEVEHSVNCHKWETIERVEGHANSTSFIKYSTVDNDPFAGINYYRLKQIDFDGNYQYSEVRSVRFDENAHLIYPNPTQGSAQVYLMTNDPVDFIEFIDALGRRQRADIINDKERVGISLKPFSSGSYTLKVVLSSGEIIYQSIIISQ